MMRSVTDQQAFANYQYEIYLAGAGDQRPELPHFAPAAWERAFAEKATPEAHGYVAGAAGAEDTLRENLEAFRRWRPRPPGSSAPPAARPADAARDLRAGPADRAFRHRAGRADAPGAGRCAADRPPRRRAGDGAR